MKCNVCNEKLFFTGKDKNYIYSKCEICRSRYRENLTIGHLELIERGYSDKYLLEKALKYMDMSKDDLIEMVNAGDEDK